MIGLLAGLAVAGTVEAGGMQVSWAWDDDALVLAVAAPTTGWVAVGFNDREHLGNSRLVMGAVRADGPVAEEHVPRPPAHPKVADLEVLGAVEAEGWTRMWIALPRDPAREDAPVVEEGARMWVTLAWSRDDDFAHHSAMRTAQWGVIEGPVPTR